VPLGEIGVKFDDIGALEDVKKSLNELIILPMRRPELFSRANLLRVMFFVSRMHSHYIQIGFVFFFLVCNQLEETFSSPIKEY